MRAIHVLEMEGRREAEKQRSREAERQVDTHSGTSKPAKSRSADAAETVRLNGFASKCGKRLTMGEDR
jgi:ribosomal protein L44E